MKTTLRMDDHLFAAVKLLAAQTGRTVNAVIEDARREELARQSRSAERPPVQLPVDTGRGLLPGVDLDDSSALLDLMEGVDGPDRR